VNKRKIERIKFRLSQAYGLVATNTVLKTFTEEMTLVRTIIDGYVYSISAVAGTTETNFMLQRAPKGVVVVTIGLGGGFDISVPEEELGEFPIPIEAASEHARSWVPVFRDSKAMRIFKKGDTLVFSHIAAALSIKFYGVIYMWYKLA